MCFYYYFVLRFKALHGGVLISFRFAVTPRAYLNYRQVKVQGSVKHLITQLLSQLSLSEIMVSGRTNIGQLVSQLPLSENVVFVAQGEP